MYEIVTLGATPYPSIAVDQLLSLLKTGYRMEKPIHCHQTLYEVMISCWRASPNERPSFEELSNQFTLFLKNEELWEERFIDLAKLFDKCPNEM
jgi:hypothetical protein